MLKMSVFGDFYPPQKWQKTQVWRKSFEMMLQWLQAIAKIDIGHKILVKLGRNSEFSIFSKFPLYFHEISYINNKAGLQSVEFFSTPKNVVLCSYYTTMHHLKRYLDTFVP